MFFENAPGKDKLASEIYEIRKQNTEKSKKSSSDYKVKIRTNDKWIEFYPPDNKILRIFSPTGLFPEKLEVLIIKKHFFLPEMLIHYFDGSIESFNDIHYKIEVMDKNA
jgi:hypothetical protein